MKICIDVDYQEQAPEDPRAPATCTALAAGVVFAEWSSPRPEAELVVPLSDVAAYVPGEFYKRELPCVLAVLEDCVQFIDTVIVDGYVFLDDAGSPGMGAHLYRALEGRVPVVGVAKNPFRGSVGAIAVHRGGSKRPLFVTAIGTDPREAADAVRLMHGSHRLPTMLKRVDRLCRDGV